MALKLEQKKEIVAKVNELASTALSVVAADYSGISSPDMTSLREQARKSGVKLNIIRNTLARIAFKGTPYECLTDKLTGPVILAFAKEEPGSTARLLRDFAKDNSNLKVTALSLGGTLLDASQLDAVASLPTYDEAVAKLLAVLQAPIIKFIRTLREPHAKLVRTLAALRDKKQANSN